MEKRLKKKFDNLKVTLSGMGRVLIAFSAGVDSAFLLKVASIVLPGRTLAVTATSPTYPKRELKQAKQIAGQLNLRIKIIRSQELENPKFAKNPSDRCYYCKRELFQKLKQIADKEKIRYVLDGSNIDDKKDWRPGNKAKRQLRVRSPLMEAGLTKQDIRSLSRSLGLRTWNKPALACLASRFPYGSKITRSALRRVEKGEDFLRELGFEQVRLRHYDDLARIEVEKQKIKHLFNSNLSHRLRDRLKKLGYNHVVVDLEGYREGSMNRTKSRFRKQRVL